MYIHLPLIIYKNYSISPLYFKTDISCTLMNNVLNIEQMKQNYKK